MFLTEKPKDLNVIKTYPWATLKTLKSVPKFWQAQAYKQKYAVSSKIKKGGNLYPQHLNHEWWNLWQNKVINFV